MREKLARFRKETRGAGEARHPKTSRGLFAETLAVTFA
jgi:hypothetical protein